MLLLRHSRVQMGDGLLFKPRAKRHLVVVTLNCYIFRRGKHLLRVKQVQDEERQRQQLQPHLQQRGERGRASPLRLL